MHERASHDANSFVTLTYRDDSVLDVSKDDCVLFLKRLRKQLEPVRIRFYLGSEYGDEGHRPHYHAIIFGHDFSKDSGAIPVKTNLFSSPILEKTWGHGFVSSGEVSPASVRYVTNYILGKDKKKVPTFMDPETGVERELAPVFALMSRRPGLGAQWIDEHSGETYRDDNIFLDGFTRRPPRYYDYRTFKGDETGKKLLQLRRRSDRLKPMLKDPASWLSNNHPARKAAAVKIDKSLRQLRKKGNLR